MTTWLPRWFACLVLLLPIVPVAAAPDDAEITRLIKQLGDDEFDKREAATTRLAEIGEPSLDALHKAETSNDAEVRCRAMRVILAIVPAIELRKLQGTWIHGSRWRDGREAPLAEEERGTTVIKGDKWVIINRAGKVIEVATIQFVNATGDLKSFDFIREKEFGGETYRCVYRIEGDMLRYCQSAPDAPEVARPTALSTQNGDGRYLASLKRLPR